MKTLIITNLKHIYFPPIDALENLLSPFWLSNSSATIMRLSSVLATYILDSKSVNLRREHKLTLLYDGLENKW